MSQRIRQISFLCLLIVHHIFQRFHFALCGLLSILYAHNVYRDTHFKNAAVNTGVGYIGWIVQHVGTDIGSEYAERSIAKRTSFISACPFCIKGKGICNCI